MGIMVQGKWTQQDFAKRNEKGSYIRPTRISRPWPGAIIWWSRTPAPGPTGR
jgi:hypothetical protein